MRVELHRALYERGYAWAGISEMVARRLGEVTGKLNRRNEECTRMAMEITVLLRELEAAKAEIVTLSNRLDRVKR